MASLQVGISATPAAIAALVHAYFAAGQGITAIGMIEGTANTLSLQPFNQQYIEPDVKHGVDGLPSNCLTFHSTCCLEKFCDDRV